MSTILSLYIASVYFTQQSTASHTQLKLNRVYNCRFTHQAWEQTICCTLQALSRVYQCHITASLDTHAISLPRAWSSTLGMNTHPLTMQFLPSSGVEPVLPGHLWFPATPDQLSVLLVLWWHLPRAVSPRVLGWGSDTTPAYPCVSTTTPAIQWQPHKTEMSVWRICRNCSKNKIIQCKCGKCCFVRLML